MAGLVGFNLRHTWLRMGVAHTHSHGGCPRPRPRRCVFEWAHTLAAWGPDGLHMTLDPQDRAKVGAGGGARARSTKLGSVEVFFGGGGGQGTLKQTWCMQGPLPLCTRTRTHPPTCGPTPACHPSMPHPASHPEPQPWTSRTAVTRTRLPACLAHPWTTFCPIAVPPFPRPSGVQQHRRGQGRVPVPTRQGHDPHVGAGEGGGSGAGAGCSADGQGAGGREGQLLPSALWAWHGARLPMPDSSCPRVWRFRVEGACLPTRPAVLPFRAPLRPFGLPPWPCPTRPPPARRTPAPSTPAPLCRSVDQQHGSAQAFNTKLKLQVQRDEAHCAASSSSWGRRRMRS